MITVTLGELLDAWQAMQSLASKKLSAKANYTLNRMLRAGTPEIQQFEEARNAFIKERGTANKDGVPAITASDAATMQAFAELVKELRAQTIELNCAPLTPDHVGESAEVTGAEMFLLGPFFDDPAARAGADAPAGQAAA